MPTQNNTITKQDINQIVNQVNQIGQKLDKLEHGQSIIYWLLGGFLAFLLFIAGLMFFTWGDVKNLQADVEVQQELAELRAQVQTLQNR